MTMKIDELEAKKEDLLESFRAAHLEYFEENPSYRPYLSYAEDFDGNAIQVYIGVEDEDGNAVCAGIDEHLTDEDGNAIRSVLDE